MRVRYITLEQATTMLLLQMVRDHNARTRNRVLHNDTRRKKREHAHKRAQRKVELADLDMREQLRDLGSERDWCRLNIVGVHQSHTPYAEWEVELLGERIHEHTLRYTTTSVGYGVGYFPIGNITRTVVVPVIQDDPIVVTESNYARTQARKHREGVAKRKRTLTDEQRREILRRENVGMRGFSRV